MMTEKNKRDAWRILRYYFSVAGNREDEETVIQRITEGTRFRGSNLWVLIFAIFIASLGLNVNSTAVIIGAMLISPLMGPIIGMGLAVGINDFSLLKKSFKNFAVATGISIITATIYFVLTPFDEVQSELLARTSPTLYDVMIAFFGGAAGILALTTRGNGNVIPGVAIATALMPPLCTAGFGLATGHFMFFLGAFYLYFINTVFICLATCIGVRMMNFKHRQFISKEKYLKVRKYIIGIGVVTMIPAGYMTVTIVKDSIEKSNIRNFIHEELQQAGTQVVDHELDKDKQMLQVVAVGKELTAAKIRSLQDRMEKYHLGDYRLKIFQGTQSDSMMLLHGRQKELNTERAEYTKTVQIQQQQLAELKKSLDHYQRYERLSNELRGEMKVLFPKVQSLSLSPTTHSDMDSVKVSRNVTALIGLRKTSSMDSSERSSLQRWLKARAKTDSIVLIVTRKE